MPLARWSQTHVLFFIRLLGHVFFFLRQIGYALDMPQNILDIYPKCFRAKKSRLKNGYLPGLYLSEFNDFCTDRKLSFVASDPCKNFENPLGKSRVGIRFLTKFDSVFSWKIEFSKIAPRWIWIWIGYEQISVGYHIQKSGYIQKKKNMHNP